MSASTAHEAILDGPVEVILAGEWPPARAGSAEEERSIALVCVVRG